MQREYILTNIVALRVGTIERGDVVVFQAPSDPDKDFIKRVVGLPGESVTLKNGSIHINNNKLDESKYLPPNISTNAESFMDENETIHLQPGEYIVLGDNRPASSDSREWGPLKKSAIIGKAFFVYWPLNLARIVKNPYK